MLWLHIVNGIYSEKKNRDVFLDPMIRSCYHWDSETGVFDFDTEFWETFKYLFNNGTAFYGIPPVL